MVKKHFIIGVVFPYIIAGVGAQAQNGCVSIGTSALDRGFDAVSLASGGILTVGYTEGIGGGLRDGYFVKINANGTFGWGKSFGGSNHEELYDIVPWGSNYALLGYTRSYGAGSADALVLVVDDAGNVLNAYTYGSSGSEQVKAGAVASSGNLIMTGFTYSYSVGSADVYFLSIDASGNISISEGIGGSGDDRGRGIAPLSGANQYVIAGYSNSVTNGGYDYFVVFLDGAGGVEWAKSIGGSLDDYGQDVISVGDTLFLVVGYTTSFGNGGEDILVVAIRRGGSIKWSKAIGGSGNERAWSIIPSGDGAFLIIGQTNSFGAGGTDGYIIKIDHNGNVLWTRTIGGSGNDFLRSGSVSGSGNIILSGWTSSFSLGSDDVFVVKLDANGNVSSNCSGCVVGSGGTDISISVSVQDWMPSITTGGTRQIPSNSTNGGGSLLVTCILDNVSVLLSGKEQGEYVELRWHVEGSEHIKDFIIEGSNDGTHFEFIDEIDNHYSAKQAYSLVVPDYWRFYRVKAITLDYADEVYSNIWTKSHSQESDIAIYTTQIVHNNLVMEVFLKRDRTCNIELITLDGKIVKREPVVLHKGTNRIVINNVNCQYPLLLRIGEHKAIVQVF